MRRFLWILLLIAVAGCTPTAPAAPAITPTAGATVGPAPTWTAAPVDVGQEPTVEVQCAFVWASRELPEYTDLVLSAYRNARMDDVTVAVSAYGENCIDPNTNEVVRFMTMQSDFYINVSVGDTEDVEALGRKLEDVLDVLLKFPPDTFPGPNPGTAFVRFDNGGQTVSLSFTMAEAQAAIDQGLRGEELYQALD